LLWSQKERAAEDDDDEENDDEAKEAAAAAAAPLPLLVGWEEAVEAAVGVAAEEE
jgi:hypothetical protein